MKTINEYSLMPDHMIPGIMYHTVTPSSNEQVIITGWVPAKHVKPGFIFSDGPTNNQIRYVVKAVKERRDHKGNFRNPEDKKDSFFSAVCTIEINKP